MLKKDRMFKNENLNNIVRYILATLIPVIVILLIVTFIESYTVIEKKIFQLFLPSNQKTLTQLLLFFSGYGILIVFVFFTSKNAPILK